MTTARTESEREYHRHLIASLRLEGHSSIAKVADALAAKYNIFLSPSTVRDDWYKVLDEWREARVADVDDHVAIEMKKLDALEDRAWEMFIRYSNGDVLTNTKLIEKLFVENDEEGEPDIQNSDLVLMQRHTVENHGGELALKWFDKILAIQDRRMRLIGGYKQPEHSTTNIGEQNILVAKGYVIVDPGAWPSLQGGDDGDVVDGEVVNASD